MEVVVIGAGYAGAIATNRLLASLTEAERRHVRVRVRVRVINPRADFVERIRLHQLAAGSRESVPSCQIRGTGIFNTTAQMSPSALPTDF